MRKILLVLVIVLIGFNSNSQTDSSISQRIDDYSKQMKADKKADELFYRVNDGRYYNRGNAADEYYYRGLEKGVYGDFRGAIQDFTKAIDINPNDANAYYYRGLAKSDLDDFRGAIQDFTKAIDIDPNDANAYHNRGIVKGILLDTNGACLDLKIAFGLGSMDAFKMIKEYCNL